jgi:hypothetical protein
MNVKFATVFIVQNVINLYIQKNQKIAICENK